MKTVVQIPTAMTWTALAIQHVIAEQKAILALPMQTAAAEVVTEEGVYVNNDIF